MQLHNGLLQYSYVHSLGVGCAKRKLNYGDPDGREGCIAVVDEDDEDEFAEGGLMVVHVVG